jgi:arylsulfatase A-like enzyme
MTMKKIQVIQALALFISLLAFGCSNPGAPLEPKAPNIVFILADDMGYGDLGCYNPHSKIATPHIDKLAEHGVIFTNAHAPGAWCVPSRYGLITGRYPGRLSSLNTRKGSLIKAEQATLASMLKDQGYRTACVGKWHLGFEGMDWENPANIDLLKGGPVDVGFDYFFGMHASLDIPPYFYIENNRAVESPNLHVDDNASEDATSDVSGAFWRAGAISPDFEHAGVLDKFREKTLAFMDNHQKSYGEDPFFLYLPLTAPHTPWLPKEEFVGKSPAGEYGDFTMQVDQLVGQVFTYLEQNKLLDHTLVVFSSDNGPVWFQEDQVKFDHLSTGALRGMKGDMWEGGSRIPFVVSAPALFSSGASSNQMICFTDLMATLAELTGKELEDPSGFDSYSFLHVLEGREAERPVRKDLVIEKKAYFSGDWKFIDGSGQGGIAARWAPDKTNIVTEEIDGELYNLKTDLWEQNNLYEEHPELVEELRNKLNNIRNNE